MQLLCEAYIELAYVDVMQLKKERGTIRPAGIEQPIALHIMYLFRVKFKLNNYDGNYIFLSSPALWQMLPFYFNLFSKRLTPIKYESNLWKNTKAAGKNCHPMEVNQVKTFFFLASDSKTYVNLK